MADKKRLTTPSGMAGLVRYEEDTESKFKIEPKIVVFISIAIIILEIILFSLF
jgi:preprotein translocase subunit Sec61beta